LLEEADKVGELMFVLLSLLVILTRDAQEPLLTADETSIAVGPPDWARGSG